MEPTDRSHPIYSCVCKAQPGVRVWIIKCVFACVCVRACTRVCVCTCMSPAPDHVHTLSCSFSLSRLRSLFLALVLSLSIVFSFPSLPLSFCLCLFLSLSLLLLSSPPLLSHSGTAIDGIVTVMKYATPLHEGWPGQHRRHMTNMNAHARQLIHKTSFSSRRDRVMLIY